MYIFATNNPGKAKEIAVVFNDAGLELYSLADLGLTLSPNETGRTYEENAIIKATETAAFLQTRGYKGITVFADDSGFEVDAFDGLPGVDSALYMGAETPCNVRNAEIIKLLEGNENRAAKFITVIACILPCGEILTTRGELSGTVSHEPRGAAGFGYDPILYIPALEKTVAELTTEQKNSISHRVKAFAVMLKILTEKKE